MNNEDAINQWLSASRQVNEETPEGKRAFKLACDIAIRRDGLYLVEAVTSDGVEWMGCRRFARGIDRALSVDDTGRGDWRDVNSLSAAGLRVAGMVQQVYRAV